MKKKQPQPKEPKPILVSVSVKEISTGTTILTFPPTRVGEKCAEKYRGLADLAIIKEYN